jgi:hypothetical protein
MLRVLRQMTNTKKEKGYPYERHTDAVVVVIAAVLAVIERRLVRELLNSCLRA